MVCVGELSFRVMSTPPYGGELLLCRGWGDFSGGYPVRREMWATRICPAAPRRRWAFAGGPGGAARRLPRISGHGPDTTLERERRFNPYVQGKYQQGPLRVTGKDDRNPCCCCWTVTITGLRWKTVSRLFVPRGKDRGPRVAVTHPVSGFT